MGKLLNKTKLGKHYRIERFGIITSVLFLLLCLFIGIGVKRHVDAKKIILTEKALYTTSTVWSKTGQDVVVQNVFRNADGTRVFVLAQVSSMDNLSTSASDYQMFLTGKTDKMTNRPVGAIYVFGNTGYMGFMLSDAKGFKSMIYNLVIRSHNSVTGTGDKTYGGYSDESFRLYNQIQIYANFAGSKGKVIPCLDDAAPDVSELYIQTVVSSEEEVLRTQLEDNASAMFDDMKKINAYGKRLNELNFMLPELPNILSSDRMVINTQAALKSPLYYDKSSTVSELSYRNLGEYKEYFSNDIPEEIERIYYATDFVLPGGCMLDYFDRRVDQKYIEGILPEGYTLRQLAQSKRDEATRYDIQFNAQKYFGDWYLYVDESGKIEKFTFDENVASDKVLQDAVNNFVEAVQSLYNHKYAYQVTCMPQFLKINLATNSIVSSFSVKSEDDALYLY